MSSQLIDALLSPACYSHQTGTIRLLETHISWVLLTGSFAYKIKKPVNYGFLDFSSLAQRRFYCEEELRLNSRFSDELYLAVVPITGSVDEPRVDGTGPVLEYAVKMQQFAQENLLDALAERGQLQERDIAALAKKLADFHTDVAAKAEPGLAKKQDPKKRLEYGSVHSIHHAALENFRQIEPLLSDKTALDDLERLRCWTEQQAKDLAGVFEQRQRSGWIRECHGDLHLANIARIDGHITLFDCLEFNPELRWIDTQSELAFLLMDLEEKHLPALANNLLNSYLEYTGDYPGLQVLNFYKVYRAMVRAKVKLLSLSADQTTASMTAARTEYGRYIDLALSYLDVPSPFLAIMHGVSGTGKSTVAAVVAGAVGAIRLRSDVERKRLFGLSPEAKSGSGIGVNIYSAEASRRTFAALVESARTLLALSYPVLVDATFLAEKWRRLFAELAAAKGVPFVILDCHASAQTIRERLQHRQEAETSVSEAGLEIMQHQLQKAEPLTRQEKNVVVHINTEEEVDVKDLQIFLKSHAAADTPE
ncbi:MAG: AAA family ATPase [Pseudomonadales bacterium]|nr:AAA family ATPase [Pseudomonadales bacterium]